MSPLFTSVYLSLIYHATLATAAPGSRYSVSNSSSRPRHTRTHVVGRRELKFSKFNPTTTYETFGKGITRRQAETSSFSSLSLKESTLAFLNDHLPILSAAKRSEPQERYHYRDGYTEGSMSYTYVHQQHKGIPFANAVGNIAFKNHDVVAFGNSFFEPSSIADPDPTFSLTDAIAIAEDLLDGNVVEGVISKLEYLAVEDGSAALVHVVQIRNKKQHTWHQGYIDAHSGELRSVVDFTGHAVYRALPLESQDPHESFELFADPHLQYSGASPNEWHQVGSTTSTDTSGNNVISFKDNTSATTPQSAPGLVFDYPADLTTSPTTLQNIHAARTNVFYITNELHDIWYLYGFTEQSYNFQQENFGKGGKGGDRVLVFVQLDDGSGTRNNAMFATPPDGQSGEMYIYPFDLSTPNRDAALANDLIIHEYAHGLSRRLVGGGISTCLSVFESSSLSEGYSDALADWATTKSAVSEDYRYATWLGNDGNGPRWHPYSTDLETNPYTYASLANLFRFHDWGQVWANLLHNVHAALLFEHGFDANAKKNPGSTAGNAVFLHLLIDALKLTPCQATFVSSRDAWIQADANRYSGSNRCLLWREFASRGLGVNASSDAGDGTEDNTVPEGC